MAKAPAKAEEGDDVPKKKGKLGLIIVIVLLALFYVFPVIIGLLGRVHAADLAQPGTADGLALVLPGRLIEGPVGDVLTALVIAGAFGAFLSTSSGLVVALAGGGTLVIELGRVVGQGRRRRACPRAATPARRRAAAAFRPRPGRWRCRG